MNRPTTTRRSPIVKSLIAIAFAASLAGPSATPTSAQSASATGQTADFEPALELGSRLQRSAAVDALDIEVAAISESPALASYAIGGSAALDSYYTRPTRTWVTDRYGYQRSTVYRGDTVRLYLTIYNATRSYRTVRATLNVVNPDGMCLWMEPPICYSTSTTITDEWLTVPPGTSNWYEQVGVSTASVPGRRTLEAIVDGDRVSSSFSIR